MAPSPLKSGTYEPKNEVRVLVWPAPDVNGDGPPVTDDAGDTWTSPDGKEIKHYNPPQGFVNKPHVNEHGMTTSDNYVLADERGNVARDVNGDAVTIAEGQAVVINPGGSFELLADNAAMRAFADSHKVVNTETPDAQPAPNTSSGPQPVNTGTAQPAGSQQATPTGVNPGDVSSPNTSSVDVTPAPGSAAGNASSSGAAQTNGGQ